METLTLQATFMPTTPDRPRIILLIEDCFDGVFVYEVAYFMPISLN